jgi:hypothetical protein
MDETESAEHSTNSLLASIACDLACLSHVCVPDDPDFDHISAHIGEGFSSYRSGLSQLRKRNDTEQGYKRPSKI